MQKRRVSILIIILIVGLLGCSAQNSTAFTSGDQPHTKPSPDLLYVHFIDIGQGGCILIQNGEHHMLIDGGNPGDGPRIVEYLRQHGVDRLEHLVATHPHADHIGGLAHVMDKITPETVWMPRYETNTKTFEELLDSIERHDLSITLPVPGHQFTLGKATLEIIAPQSEDYTQLNNASIVLRLRFGDTTMLFPGDAEAMSEADMLASDLDLQAMLLQVGHHGSSSSTTPDFLDAVSPQVAVIQVGSDNMYNHPDDETVKKLTSREIAVFRNDLDGTVIVCSDGGELSVTCSGHPNDPAQVFLAPAATPPPPPTATSGGINPPPQASGYIGNKNSLVFHITTCGSLPKEDNRVFFETREDAVQNGYRPCSRCKP